ncbi:NADP-dependent oxidoreductase domain-containing protein [Blastocladiella britannica]|nr:NADP-dependent oxidoreductase domain-containing protein [Blastocladiella britannica]
MPSYTLNTKLPVPALAYGTGTKWFKRGDSTSPISRDLVDAIKAALTVGVRHIDTAEIYNTEAEVGVAVREFLAENNGTVTRTDLYITSKIYPGLGDVDGTVRKSLELLQTEYIDLYLIHAPFLDRVANLPADYTISDAWRKLEAHHASGVLRSIGVSNFDLPHLDELVAGGSAVVPAVNQIEFHPLLPQPILRAGLTSRGIIAASYGPLVPLNNALETLQASEPGRAFLAALDAPAARLGVDRSAVLLRWNLDQGHIVVSTSAKVERVVQFLAIGSDKFALTASERDAISSTGAAADKLRKFWPTGRFQE